MNDDEMLTIREAAAVLRRSPRWVRTSPHAPPLVRLSPRRFGVMRSAIDRLIRARTAGISM